MKSGMTKHSVYRMKERLGINERKAKKRLFDAVERGTSAEAFSSWEHSFLVGQSRNNCVAVAYNGYCYIIGEDKVCVTLYPLPVWFGKKKHFDGKEKIRNVKKYYKTHLI